MNVLENGGRTARYNGAVFTVGDPLAELAQIVDEAPAFDLEEELLAEFIRYDVPVPVEETAAEFFGRIFRWPEEVIRQPPTPDSVLFGPVEMEVDDLLDTPLMAAMMREVFPDDKA